MKFSLGKLMTISFYHENFFLARREYGSEKALKTAKAVNEDPACLYRRSNQPNLKNNDEKCKDYCKADTT